MKKILGTFVLAALLVSTAAAAHETVTPAYKDRSLPDSVRVADLLGRLTIEEKASLMRHSSSAVERLDIRKYNWWNEALHGVARNGSATVFPQPIGMAASFDEKLLEAVFTAVSDEARVKNRLAAAEGNGVNIYQGVTFWTPNINIFRDPRWGRGMETYGEDPYLTGVMGMAVVRGLQGDPDSEILKTHACAKHFAVHSGPESTRHSFDARVSERDLRETYLPAFKDLVTKAGVQEVMTAYNRFEGEPCGASAKLMKEILRGEWGFKGMIVSDCGAVDDFYMEGRHGFSSSRAEAVAAAVKNGVDVECGWAYRFIPEAIEQGLLTEEDLDRCLAKALKARYELGEMDGESLWDSIPDEFVESEENLALSLEMARESIVLLQNRDGALPLGKDEKLALIGPNADDAQMMWGNYNAVPVKGTITLLDAMQAMFPELVSFRACGIVDPSGQNGDGEKSELAESMYPELDVDEVLRRLEGIGTVIFAGGISPRFEGEDMPVAVNGFCSGDRTDIELPAVQRELLKALHEAGKKVIFVNFSGSAIAMVPETVSCDAILQVWYPGQQGGQAIAEVLFGEVNPSGKLPVTFYRFNDQLPDFSDYDMEGHTYRYFRGEPLFPFGHGLSYTTFKYRRPKISDGCLSVKVKNTGKVDGTETVQLYVSRPDDKEGPIRTLRGFRRVFIPAGETVEVTFALDEETFEWWDGEVQNMVPRHGKYRLHVGGSSDSSSLRRARYRF